MATCRVCGNGFEAGSVLCTKCFTPHHEDCFMTGGCSVFGCGSVEYGVPKYENGNLVSLQPKKVEKQAQELSDIVTEKSLAVREETMLSVPQRVSTLLSAQRVDDSTLLIHESILRRFLDAYATHRVNGLRHNDAFYHAEGAQPAMLDELTHRAMRYATSELDFELGRVSYDEESKRMGRKFKLDTDNFFLTGLTGIPLAILFGNPVVGIAVMGFVTYDFFKAYETNKALRAHQTTMLEPVKQKIIRRYALEQHQAYPVLTPHDCKSNSYSCRDVDGCCEVEAAMMWEKEKNLGLEGDVNPSGQKILNKEMQK